MSETVTEEASPEAAAILRDAGWTPHPEWGVYTRATLVMGGIAGSFHVKDYTRIPPGHPQYGPDTPDTAEEAAAWLVARFAPNPLTSEATLEPVALQSEEVDTPGYESNGETGEETGASAGAAAQSETVPGDRIEGGFDAVSDDAHRSTDGADDESGHEGAAGLQERGPDSDGFVDADFTIEDLGGPEESEQLEGPIEDFAPDEFAPEEDQSGAFIFGDNLHQMRTAAIGLVVQAAIERLPAGIDYARLAELRNFVMGVSEGRWPDDTTKRDELDTLEATERKRRGVEAVRDEKVAFLVGASREEIEDFAVDAGWPE